MIFAIKNSINVFFMRFPSPISGTPERRIYLQILLIPQTVYLKQQAYLLFNIKSKFLKGCKKTKLIYLVFLHPLFRDSSKSYITTAMPSAPVSHLLPVPEASADKTHNMHISEACLCALRYSTRFHKRKADLSHTGG